MEITEVRVKLMEDASERLRAFCSITFDNCFVVRDLKIIEGTHGPFVAMPSRKLTAHCPKCGCKNHLRAQFCNQCGTRFRETRAPRDEEGRPRLYADIAHPINSECREMIQQRVIRAFQDEVERSKQPGYVPSYIDFDHESYDFEPEEESGTSARPRAGKGSGAAPPAAAQPRGDAPRGGTPEGGSAPQGGQPPAPAPGETSPSDAEQRTAAESTPAEAAPPAPEPPAEAPPPTGEQPRGPHTPQKDKRTSVPWQRPPKGEFGEGIL
jgi:stage V sporulation protein G